MSETLRFRRLRIISESIRKFELLNNSNRMAALSSNCPRKTLCQYYHANTPTIHLRVVCLSRLYKQEIGLVELVLKVRKPIYNIVARHRFKHLFNDEIA